MDSRSEVRGSAVVPTMELVMFRYGKQTYAEILNRLDERQKQVFRKRMKPTEWIALSDFVAFNQAIVDVVYDGDRNFAEKLGAEVADISMKGFTKTFVKLTDIRFSFRKATSIFVGYYRPAKLTVVKNEPGYCEALIEHLNDPEGLIALRVKGFIRRLFELAGRNPHKMVLRKHRTSAKILIQIWY